MLDCLDSFHSVQADDRQLVERRIELGGSCLELQALRFEIGTDQRQRVGEGRHIVLDLPHVQIQACRHALGDLTLQCGRVAALDIGADRSDNHHHGQRHNRADDERPP